MVCWPGVPGGGVGSKPGCRFFTVVRRDLAGVAVGEAKGCPDEARDRLRGQRVWPAGGAVWGAVWPAWLAHRDAFPSWSSLSLVSSPFLYK